MEGGAKILDFVQIRLKLCTMQYSFLNRNKMELTRPRAPECCICKHAYKI